MATVTADAVHLRASGVSLVVAVGESRLPRVTHWGADLGEDQAPELGDDGPGERRALPLLPERSWGWMGAPGIAGHRAGRDHSTRFVTNAVDLTTEGEGAREVQRLSVLAADAAADLALTVVIEMLASGLVRARATIASTGYGSAGPGSAEAPGYAAPFILDAMTLALPVPARASELSPYPGRDERLLFVRSMHSRESRGGTPGRDGSALLAAGTEGFGYRTGEVWVTHVAWSGNVRHLAERADGCTQSIGGGELLLSGETLLEPGEPYASPWVYFSYGAGLDEASSRFHRFLRARSDHPTKPRPVVATTAGVDLDLERLTALADASAGVGAELFVLGAGWFKGGSAGRGGGEGAGGLGDWYVDKAIFPEGLRPFADYVRGLGLEFGLWFAPERVSETSDLAREHPEWMVGQALDLANPEAFSHIEERLHALVEELRPTHLVWDHPRDLVGGESSASGRAIGHAQTRAFYELLDGLRGSFPGLEIEVRADGGGRSDLEVLLRAERVRATRAADSFVSREATALLVPPELTALDLAAGPGLAGRGVRGDRSSAALWGHLGFEWSAADPIPSTDQLADLRAWIELFKRYRKLLHTGEVVRSDAPGGEVALRGVISGNRREALYGFTGGDSATPDTAPLLHLDGLDPARAYRVTVVRDPLAFEDAAPEDAAPEDAIPPPGWWESGVIVSGRMLAAHGIQAPPRGPSGMVLLHVERAKAAPHHF
jgi:alpha-galactosidase